MPEKKINGDYPWAELYNLESRVPGTPPVVQSRRGRPNQVYPRSRTTVMLSDEEMAMLDEITYQIKVIMRPASVTKGQAMGMAIRLLKARLDQLPRKASNWKEIIAVLFS